MVYLPHLHAIDVAKYREPANHQELNSEHTDLSCQYSATELQLPDNLTITILYLYAGGENFLLTPNILALYPRKMRKSLGMRLT